MKINKKILTTMLLISFLSINVATTPKAEASCDFSISFVNSICQYFTGETSDTNVADNFEEQSSGDSESETSKQYVAQIQDINAYMANHNGSLPPNMHITGKKKMPDGTYSVAIKDESGLNNRGMNEIVVTLAPDGQSFAPLNLFHNESEKSDTEVLQEEYNKLTTPVAEGGENELSDSDMMFLNTLQSEGTNIVNSNGLMETISNTLGVSKEEIATAVAGGVSLAGIYLVSAMSGDGSNSTPEKAKTLLEKATARVVRLRQKYNGNNTTGGNNGDGTGDGDSNATKNAEGNKSTASSGEESVRTYNPVDLARIRQSINNLPETSVNCNPTMFSVVKSYILENNSRDWNSQTINGLTSCIINNAQKYNVSALAIVAQLKAESNFNPAVTSPAGACGIAQFMPSTARGFGINPWDVGEAIDGQCRYMSNLMKNFGDYSLAWAGYNAGGGAVESYGGIPPYAETQNYVSKLSSIVGDLTQRYNQLKVAIA